MHKENYPNILLVDDELRSALLIKQLILNTYPHIHNVRIVHSISEALTYLETNNIDILLLDIELKGESGFDLLDKIREHSFKFICISASREYAYKAFQYGCAGYVLKPVNSKELVHTLSRTCSLFFSASTLKSTAWKI